MSGQTVFPDHHLPESPVDIYSDHASHARLPCQLKTAGAAGNTTTTDSCSRHKRASRRGGQLLTRALGSSYGSACRHLRAPGASVPDARSIHPDPRIRAKHWHRDPHTGYECHREPEPRDPQVDQDPRLVPDRAGRDQADLPGDPKLRERRPECPGMVCGPESIRYHVRRAIQCVTVSETRMGQPRYTKFRTLPAATLINAGSS